MEDNFIIANKKFNSRLIVGTGKYKSFKQSNIEGEIVTLIQTAKNEFDGIIINAAGYTHTSVSILDALLATKLPVIEIHISNIYSREEYRQKSLISKAAKGIICGFGINGYIMALDAMKNFINK